MSTSNNIHFKQYLASAKPQGAAVPAGLQELLIAVVNTCSTLSHEVAQGALIGLLGSAGTGNVQGEVQQKLDIIANDLLIDGVKSCKSLAGLASEEMELPVPVQGTGDYLLLFDPLDGSSNIDVNVSIGTIFSILECPKGVTKPDVAAFMQPGSKQLAAGFVVYGPSTLLVLTVGKGSVGFTLDRDAGTFVLTQEKVSVPADTSEFAINASNSRHWYPPVTRYVDEMLAGKTGPRGKDFNMRWIASMVADVHRILNRGGIFMYPADLREPEKAGKLRLMYEANPMAMIVEQAGGMATNGKERILDIQPTALHQRVAVFLGSRNEVELVTSYHKE